MSAVLKHIAAIAKGLSKAELHVLIELAARAEASRRARRKRQQPRASRSDRTGALERPTRPRLPSQEGIILSDAGTATKPAMHRLLFLDAVEIQIRWPDFQARGGPGIRPGWLEIRASGGPISGPGWPDGQASSGPKFEPRVA